jgi:hypothetical protein
VYPYLASSRLTTRLSPRGYPTESWAPCGVPGDRVFHDTRERFGGLQLDTRCLASSPLTVFSMGGLRAWALSSHGARCNRASDTSVASPSSAECRSAFASPSALALASVIAFPREEAAKVAVTTSS